MSMKDAFPYPMFAKSLYTELQWKNAKCSNCGADLPKYSYYSDYGECKICENCGNRHLLVRRLVKRN